jgi:hypothetical protein
MSRTGAISLVSQGQRGRNRAGHLPAGARGPAFVNGTKDEPDGDRNGGHHDPADDRGDRRGSGREGNDDVDHSGDDARDHDAGHGGTDLHGDSLLSLLYRYITQGRVEADRPHLSPRRVARLLLTRPDALSDSQQALLSELTAGCPEMTSLAGLVRSFAALLKPDPGNQAKLKDWTETARACDLPNIHAFARGLDLDTQAVIAAVTMPFHNGRTQGVNTKTKILNGSVSLSVVTVRGAS